MKNNYYFINPKMRSTGYLDLESSWPMQSWDLSHWYAQDQNKKPTEVRRGKVRQLFEDRRCAGRDKSYPLEPLTQRGVSLDRGINSVDKQQFHSQNFYQHSSNNNNQLKLSRSQNFSGGQVHQPVVYLSESLKPVSQFSVSDMASSKKNQVDYQGKQLTYALHNLTLANKAKDAPVSKSNVRSTNSSPSARTVLSRTGVKSLPTKVADEPIKDLKIRSSTSSNKPSPDSKIIRSPPKVNSSDQPKSISRPSVSRNSGVKSSIQDSKTTADGPSIDEQGMSACKVCGRKFLEERLGAHERACSKLHTKKRKPFVARKMIEGQTPIRSKAKATPQAKSKSNWRKTHEEFVANIRAARQAQKILDAGGSLADLPPPPPSDTSHLTPCEYCGRKFSESAAARHIPLCKEKALRAKLAGPKAKGTGSSNKIVTSRLPATKGAR